MARSQAEMERSLVDTHISVGGGRGSLFLDRDTGVCFGLPNDWRPPLRYDLLQTGLEGPGGQPAVRIRDLGTDAVMTIALSEFRRIS